MPESDPHHIDSAEQKKAKREAAIARKWDRRAAVETSRFSEQFGDD